jgi:hypothetical protein
MEARTEASVSQEISLDSSDLIAILDSAAHAITKTVESYQRKNSKEFI